MPEPSRLLPGQRSAADSQRTDAPAGVEFHRTPGRRWRSSHHSRWQSRTAGLTRQSSTSWPSLIGFAKSKKYAPRASVNQS
jgi:hypothetical protein